MLSVLSSPDGPTSWVPLSPPSFALRLSLLDVGASAAGASTVCERSSLPSTTSFPELPVLLELPELSESESPVLARPVLSSSGAPGVLSPFTSSPTLLPPSKYVFNQSVYVPVTSDVGNADVKIVALLWPNNTQDFHFIVPMLPSPTLPSPTLPTKARKQDKQRGQRNVSHKRGNSVSNNSEVSGNVRVEQKRPKTKPLTKQPETQPFLPVAELVVFLAKFFDYQLADVRAVERDDAIVAQLVPIMIGLQGIVIRIMKGKDAETSAIGTICDRFRKIERLSDLRYLEYPREEMETIKLRILNSACSDKIKSIFRGK